MASRVCTMQVSAPFKIFAPSFTRPASNFLVRACTRGSWAKLFESPYAAQAARKPVCRIFPPKRMRNRRAQAMNSLVPRRQDLTGAPRDICLNDKSYVSQDGRHNLAPSRCVLRPFGRTKSEIAMISSWSMMVPSSVFSKQMSSVVALFQCQEFERRQTHSWSIRDLLKDIGA